MSAPSRRRGREASIQRAKWSSCGNRCAGHAGRSQFAGLRKSAITGCTGFTPIGQIGSSPIIGDMSLGLTSPPIGRTVTPLSSLEIGPASCASHTASPSRNPSRRRRYAVRRPHRCQHEWIWWFAGNYSLRASNRTGDRRA
jgi:hypothetical protein